MVRFKNRYIAIEVKEERGVRPGSKLSSKDLYHKIYGTVSRLHGDYGIASIRNGFSASYCNEITKIAILRVRHGPHKFVTSVLPVINNIGDVPVIINTLYVGATLHQCYKFILSHQKKSLIELLPNIPDEDKSKFENEFLNFDGILAKNKRIKE
ncbi:hypothetical protein O3M35_012830 [Rhynocoris fuscipes]|uniref:Ribonuclease P/MRP protein subunit POP5 n=1 Tax=Rhynocoris fuscipes TaxID=488301 RepID=A0AAW1CLC8_9HEMI